MLTTANMVVLEVNIFISNLALETEVFLCIKFHGNWIYTFNFTKRAEYLSKLEFKNTRLVSADLQYNFYQTLNVKAQRYSAFSFWICLIIMWHSWKCSQTKWVLLMNNIQKCTRETYSVRFSFALLLKNWFMEVDIENCIIVYILTVHYSHITIYLKT